MAEATPRRRANPSPKAADEESEPGLPDDWAAWEQISPAELFIGRDARLESWVDDVITAALCRDEPARTILATVLATEVTRPARVEVVCQLMGRWGFDKARISRLRRDLKTVRDFRNELAHSYPDADLATGAPIWRRVSSGAPALAGARDPEQLNKHWAFAARAEVTLAAVWQVAMNAKPDPGIDWQGCGRRTADTMGEHLAGVDERHGIARNAPLPPPGWVPVGAADLARVSRGKPS